MKHILRPALGILLAAGLTLSVSAAEMDSRATHCFAPEEFSSEDGTLAGICLTALPEKHLGTVMLGERVLRPGDVLTACQVGEMTFVAGGPEESATAAIRYLPVFSNGLAGEATMTLSIRGRENKPPIAEDGAFETYKNLEITNHLKVRDPEEQEMTFCLVREPKRGTVVLKEDGSFTYTPKKNKVGIDSFVYTATDAAGKTSREATVTIQIRKPTDASQYSDTLGRGCRFAAEWMKNTGIFTGECIGGSPCFSPDKEVSRGEFVTMLVKALQIPTDSRVTETGYPDVPEWLRPYLAAAIRSGLTSGLASSETFAPDQPVTCADAAAMLCAALGLQQQEQPALSAEALPPDYREVAAQNGFDFSGALLNRSDAATVLYQASQYRNP